MPDIKKATNPEEQEAKKVARTEKAKFTRKANKIEKERITQEIKTLKSKNGELYLEVQEVKISSAMSYNKLHSKLRITKVIIWALIALVILSLGLWIWKYVIAASNPTPTSTLTVVESSPTPPPSSTPTPTPTPTPSPAPTPTPTPSPAPTLVAISIPTTEPTLVPTPEPTFKPTATPTPTPTSTPTPTPNPTPNPTPKPTPRPTPSPSPTQRPTPPQKPRIATGKGQPLSFQTGDKIVGWAIIINGKYFEGGKVLYNAPTGGTLIDGAINPWPEEVTGVTELSWEEIYR